MKKIRLTPYTTFENVDFYDETIILLSQSDFESVQFKEDRVTFYIYGCRFLSKLIIKNTEAINFKGIIFDFVGCVIEDIDIDTIESNNISIAFYSTIVSGRIEGNKIEEIRLNNCIVKHLFLISQNSVNISLSNGNIFPRVWKKVLRGGEGINDILSTRQSYYVYDSRKIVFETSHAASNDQKGVFRSNYQTIEDYKIGYNFSEDQKKKLDVSLHIQYSQKVENADTVIINSLFNNLELSGYSNSTIRIENTKINNWFIRDFSSQKEISFYNIGPLEPIKSKLEIHKSNLDKTWFDNIDFSKYEVISFYRTRFGKSTFTSCNFPKDSIGFENFKTLENIHYVEKKPENFYKNQYEVFLQLKVLLEATGNSYEAQKLQAVSNDALKKIVHSPSDRFILCLNSISNNHGLSITRPFWLFVGFSIVFYVLYLLSLGKIFNSHKIDWQLIGYYFSFIDITHRIDFLVDKKELIFFSLAVDFCSKITLSFFLYQFVAAFRKYGKK